MVELALFLPLWPYGSFLCSFNLGSVWSVWLIEELWGKKFDLLRRFSRWVCVLFIWAHWNPVPMKSSYGSCLSSRKSSLSPPTSLSPLASGSFLDFRPKKRIICN
uniref:Uncharacterized protein n=1 Tax=Picea glauca TaxID=3330 RepID=A0A101LVG1_PICGL|nr:hypothetical protein ABT39_MTgene1888 [Picea glauca]